MESLDTATVDVAVVGIGRVGLPLAICFADCGLQVLGVDVDTEKIAAVSEGRMPFEETGMQEVLTRVHQNGGLHCSSHVPDAARADHIVLTLGTPALSHIEIDVSQIRAVLDVLLDHLRDGQTLVLRSTVAPGTTEFVAGYIHKRRPELNVHVAHCPERIAEGRFLQEIYSFPCIVSGMSDEAAERAAALFSCFGTEIVRTTPVQAELAKIWSNIYRYTMFALPNLLMMNCEQHGANVFDVIDLVNHDYPRGGMARPGFTAGTCLRKDFAFSEERSHAPGMLLAVSRVNESVPLFVVEGLRQRLGGSLASRKVAVLGLAFKGNTDDERDSLSHKLIRLLERELADVSVHDARVPTPTEPFDDVLRGAEGVVIAANHSEFSTPAAMTKMNVLTAPGCVVADPWNALGVGTVFSVARSAAGRERLAA